MMEKKTVAVLGMMCASCAANVEKRLNSMEGVEEASVNLANRTVQVDFDPQSTSLAKMKESLAAIGYDMIIEEDQNVEAIEQRAMTLLKRRVILAWLLAFGVMALSMGWIGASWSFAIRSQTQMLLALACLVFCGRQFYASAWRQLMHCSANMDTLVALSTAISFGFSVFNTFWGEHYWGGRGIAWYTYYDASVMIVAFVLTGRLLEERAKNSTASAIRSLMGLAPKTAHLVDDSTHDIPIAAVQTRDILEVRTGEKIPVDGIVISSEGALIDESMMTGEAVAVAKEKGDKVLAGTLLRAGTFRFRAGQVGQQTVLAGIIRMVQQAQGSKAPVQRTVDKIALVFVPTIVMLAVATFIIWMILGGTQMLPNAILSAVSVLVVACPCAMGLATPTALMVGIGKAAQRNILVKDAVALEQLRRVDAMVFDKTGTITVQNKETAEEVPASSLDSEQLSPHAREALSQLRNKGIDLYLMSGDREERVSHWASEAGIDHWQAGVMPQDKENLVRRLQAEGRCVAMVGDGINDSQALAAADVSIAMGRGTDVAMDVAQVTLMGSDLRRIGEAIDMSRCTIGMIRQNLFWAFIYNIVCIPLAAGLPYLFGIEWQITPVLASALMAFSSVSVVLNSLRLKFMSPSS